MTVPLKPGWESKVSSIKPRIYPLGNEARQVVDDRFDEMHRQGRLEYTTDPTPFSFPVFVIYKTDSHGKIKGRAVVDIWKLNDLVLPDSYSFPLQSEIIANVQGCTNLAVLDVASFFYQWRLHSDHRFIFTVIIHRGQETFLVPIMGYINSVAYVQRKIDNILHNVREWHERTSMTSYMERSLSQTCLINCVPCLKFSSPIISLLALLSHTLITPT